MSNAKHTPGPWFIKDGEPMRIVNGFDPDHIHICTINGLTEEAHADADLIAAAPETAAERDALKAVNAELVAALERILASAECMNEWYDPTAIEQARAALLKAREA